MFVAVVRLEAKQRPSTAVENQNVAVGRIIRVEEVVPQMYEPSEGIGADLRVRKAGSSSPRLAAARIFICGAQTTSA
jgi:hypothetical protein